MKQNVFLTVTVSLAVLAGTALAEPAKKEEQTLRLELDLVDGSRIVGVPGIASVPVQTTYAKMDLPLKQIRTLKIGKDRETVSFDLRNGDKLTGVLTLGSVKLETPFGKVTIGIEHLRELRVVLTGGAATQKGLVLWNQLESESDMKESRVGPGGKLNGGRFVEGRFGKGVELNMQEREGVTFPPEIVPGPEGCIEFWAKLVNFPPGIPDGPNPALIKIGPDDGTGWDFELAFGPNDGNSDGGLIINSALGWVATGHFGSWTYARALGAENASDWHHYALVWKGNGGIPGVPDTGRQIVAYIDGKLNTTRGINNPHNSNIHALATPGRFCLLGRATASIAEGRVVFDNLKIWDFAKTDFSDRTDE